MAAVEHKKIREKATHNIVLIAQELAWAAGVPLTRVDWHPNPELEDAEHPAPEYLLTLSTNARRAKERVSAEWLEKAASGVDESTHQQLERLVAALKDKSA